MLTLKQTQQYNPGELHPDQMANSTDDPKLDGHVLLSFRCAYSLRSSERERE
jgi:hypothetical protein